MAHLNVPGTDWVVTAFVVHPREPKVVLCLHKKLGSWLGVGGHIELDTADPDPDGALARELLEETGLLLGRDAYVYQTDDQRARRACVDSLPPGRTNRARAHHVPWAMETHDFTPIPGHYHLALVYLVVAVVDRLVLEAAAHDALRWFDKAELADPTLPILDTVRYYAVQAVNTVHPDAVQQ